MAKKKSKPNWQKKICVGDNTCVIADAEMGCAPWNVTCPMEDIDFQVSCKYQEHRASIKCNYDGECDFQDEVIDGDVEEYPELFCRSYGGVEE